jgi:hypothetical protein
LTSEEKVNPRYLGDSYDIVKRFFCEALRGLGYTVFIDPTFTSLLNEKEGSFYSFLGVKPLGERSTDGPLTALFLDPDTGVGSRDGARHVSLSRIGRELQHYAIVFAFDQAFSRQSKPKDVMALKLSALRELGCSGFFYDSHARFLFASGDPIRLASLRRRLFDLGLPGSRFVGLDDELCQQSIILV